MASKTCLWHECGALFVPSDHRQEFCTPSCRKKRGAWKAKRGGPLVDMLLRGEVEGLMAAKTKLQSEIKENTP